MPRATLSVDNPRRKLSSGFGGRSGLVGVLGLAVGLDVVAAAASARGCGSFGNKVDGMSSAELVFVVPGVAFDGPPLAPGKDGDAN